MNDELNDWFKRIKGLKEQLRQELKEKHIISPLDRKRVFKEALGFETTQSGISEENLVKVLEYLKQKTPEELESDVIAWAYRLDDNEPLTKKQIKILTDLIPSDVELNMFQIEDDANFNKEHPKFIGYVNARYAKKYENDIQKLLKDICDDSLSNKKEIFLEIANEKKLILKSNYSTVSSSLS